MVLAMGSRGEKVRQLQQLLNQIVTDPVALRVDGIFGPKTRERVILFQKRTKLQTDGIVGPHTSKALVGSILLANLRGQLHIPRSA